MIKTFNITTYTITSYMQTIRSIPLSYHYTIPHTPFAQWSKKKGPNNDLQNMQPTSRRIK
jgi:hypothetical protein